MRGACVALMLGALVATGCSAKPLAPELARESPVFSVEQFFLGRTAGQGSLKIRFKEAQTIRVEGRGWAGPDGALVLDQIVWRDDRPAEKRQWRLRPIGPGRYAGSLSDAAGPVQGEVRGNLLHLNYPMKGGVHAEQWIYLQTDGQTALNRMAITKFGITVARLDETIRKID